MLTWSADDKTLVQVIAMHILTLLSTGWRKKNACVFQIIVTLFIFNIKKIMSTPKQPVINAVLITYINYSITENYIGKMASFLP